MEMTWGEFLEMKFKIASIECGWDFKKEDLDEVQKELKKYNKGNVTPFDTIVNSEFLKVANRVIDYKIIDDWKIRRITF